jgi:hypothetical protein
MEEKHTTTKSDTGRLSKSRECLSKGFCKSFPDFSRAFASAFLGDYLDLARVVRIKGFPAVDGLCPNRTGQTVDRYD